MGWLRGVGFSIQSRVEVGRCFRMRDVSDRFGQTRASMNDTLTSTGVELRHRKIRARLTRGLVRLMQLAVLPLQRLHLIGHIGRMPVCLPLSISAFLPHSFSVRGA